MELDDESRAMLMSAFESMPLARMKALECVMHVCTSIVPDIKAGTELFGEFAESRPN